MSNIVLSIDGRKEINDLMRPTRNNHGSSYDIIMPKFKKVAESRNQMNYYVRGTFTHNNLDFQKMFFILLMKDLSRFLLNLLLRSQQIPMP